MATDKNGNPILKGDIVYIACKVKWVHDTEEGCNLNVETLEPIPGDDTSHFGVSSKQVEKA